MFLAAKVEEQPRKLEHVIKVAHACLHPQEPQLDTKSDVGGSHGFKDNQMTFHVMICYIVLTGFVAVCKLEETFVFTPFKSFVLLNITY